MKTEVIYQVGEKVYALYGQKADQFLNSLLTNQDNTSYLWSDLSEKITCLSIKNKVFAGEKKCFTIRAKSDPASLILENCTFQSERVELRGIDLILKKNHFLEQSEVVLKPLHNLELEMSSHYVTYEVVSEYPENLKISSPKTNLEDRNWVHIKGIDIHSIHFENRKSKYIKDLVEVKNIQELSALNSNFHFIVNGLCSSISLKNSQLTLEGKAPMISLHHSSIEEEMYSDNKIILKEGSFKNFLRIHDEKNQIVTEEDEKKYLILRLLYLLNLAKEKKYQNQNLKRISISK